MSTRAMFLVVSAVALGACVRVSATTSPDTGHAALPDGSNSAGGMDLAGGQDADTSSAPETFTLAAPETLASRLSLFLWNEEAKEDLVARLQQEPLDVPRLSSIADEMLSDPRAQAGVRTFFRWWLLLDRLEHLEKVDPDSVLDPALRLAMTDEAPHLGAYITLEARGTYADLLTTTFTFVNERLARHYGLSGISGDHFRRVSYPEGQNRIGLLTGTGLLTLFASLASPSWPAKRSWLITDQILCAVPIRTFLPPPPIDPNRSIREQMLTITKDGTCKGCHDTLNSPGFAFIGFDSFGRWRPEAGHGPGETEGWIPSEILADEPRFNGPEQLARLLASRDRASLCFARFWLQFAVDRKTPVTGERPEMMERSLATVHSEFARSGYQLRQLPLAIVRSRSFASAR